MFKIESDSRGPKKDTFADSVPTLFKSKRQHTFVPRQKSGDGLTFLSKTPAFDRIPNWPHNTYLHQRHHMIRTVQLASSLSFVFGIRVCVVCATTYTLPGGGPVIFAPPSKQWELVCEGAERGINPCHTHTHRNFPRKLFLCVIDAGANLRTAKCGCR